MPARSLWKGSISFGLVNIPVKIYSSAEAKEFSFNQLCENGHRLQYKRWCPVENREVPWNEIKRGFEVQKDRYGMIDKSELQEVQLKTTKTIDIKEFVSYDKMDPIFVEKSYYVAPDTKTVDKAYMLFSTVLRNTKKIAIGKVVLREKEQLVALRAYQRGLLMHQLHYLDEIRPIDEIKEISTNSGAKVKIDEQEISLGKTLVDNLTSKDLDLSGYSDQYATQLRNLIEAKSHGKTIVAKEEEKPGQAKPDLLEALKASVQRSSGKAKKG